MWRGKTFHVDLLSKIKIEITINDVDVENRVNTVISKSRTGNIDDGKVFITHVEMFIVFEQASLEKLQSKLHDIIFLGIVNRTGILKSARKTLFFSFAY